MLNFDPKLRSANKSVPAFPLNKFPDKFHFNVGEQLIYILATRGKVGIEGKEWESIFAKAIGAEWKPSVIGLDDIVMGNTAWGAKSILSNKPSSASNIRLISGRNDLINSFDYNVQPGSLPDEHGQRVLSIYNERVSRVKEHYKHVRTVVLIRSNDLTECVVYETETVRYDPDLFYWKWSSKLGRKNLYGYSKLNDNHKFTWQSGGQQFTIHETVPTERVVIKIKSPDLIPKDIVLNAIKYEKDWIQIEKLPIEQLAFK